MQKDKSSQTVDTNANRGNGKMTRSYWKKVDLIQGKAQYRFSTRIGCRDRGLGIMTLAMWAEGLGTVTHVFV